MQTTMFSTGDVDAARAPSSYLDDPTAIVASVSGGLDSSVVAIWARQRWPEQPLILGMPTWPRWTGHRPTHRSATWPQH